VFTIKKGPTLLWSVTTVVQRTQDRVNGITGVNPIVIEDDYHLAVFEVKVITQVNLAITGLRILGSLTGTSASTTIGFPPVNAAAQAFANPVNGSVPLLQTGQATVAPGIFLVANISVGTLGIVPPALLLEYDTAAPGATPNLVFEVRGSFYGGPFYITRP